MPEMLLYLAGSGLLLGAYWIVFGIYGKRRSRGLALTLAILQDDHEHKARGS